MTDNMGLNYKITKRLEPGLKSKATITAIKEAKGEEIVKSSARNPQQVLYVIYAKVNGWEGKIGQINKPPSEYISDRSKMAQFIQRYGQQLAVGMQVDVETNKNGYWSLLT